MDSPDLVIGSAGLILAPLAIWQLSHPTRISDIVDSYQIYQPGLNTLQGAKDLLSWHSIATRSDVYWNAFNPSMLSPVSRALSIRSGRRGCFLFGGFYRDFMGEWRERSSLHFGGNIKGAMG